MPRTEIAIRDRHPVLLLFPDVVDLQKEGFFFLAQISTHIEVGLPFCFIILGLSLFETDQSVLFFLTSPDSHLGCVKLLGRGLQHFPQYFKSLQAVLVLDRIHYLLLELTHHPLEGERVRSIAVIGGQSTILPVMDTQHALYLAFGGTFSRA